MSRRALGNQREHAFEAQLWRFGYRTMLAKGSGQRIASAASDRPLRGDLIALAPAGSGLPHLLAECGGVGKRLGTAFRDLIGDGLPPGFAALVVRVISRKWIYNSTEDDRFDDLGDALDSLRTEPLASAS